MPRRRQAQIPRELDLSGPLCLAFANTAATRRDNRYNERAAQPITRPLESYPDLVAWGLRLGVLTAVEADSLVRLADIDLNETRVVFQRVLGFRAALFRIFQALAAKKPLDVKDVGVLNAVFDAAPVRHVVVRANGCGWDWECPDERLDGVLWPVAQSAAELLTSERRQRVRVCANKDCTWLFLPKSPLREWCDQNACGSRAWAKRNYRKYKQ